MAKASFVKAIKAKPNERGRTSHLPIYCDTKNCKNEALVIKGKFDKRIKLCYDCLTAPKPVKRTNVSEVQATLRALGFIH